LRRQLSRESWYRAITRSAAQIRQRFGVPDQATEDRMVRAFRAALRPRKKAGRKPDQATARAAEMWTAGKKCAQQRALWQRIYREVFPDFPRMDKPVLLLATHLRPGSMAKGRPKRHPSRRIACRRCTAPP
jgi:hypothetical protein